MQAWLGQPGFLGTHGTFGADLSFILAVVFTLLFLLGWVLARKGKGSHHHTVTLSAMVAMIVYFAGYYLARNLGVLALEGKEGFGLRVSVATGGCAGLSYDLRFQKAPYDNDILAEQDGLPIFIHPESASFLKGVQIDFKDTLKESGFQYKNPNATQSCGCGISFS